MPAPTLDQAANYLKTLGYSNPDAGELAGAQSDLAKMGNDAPPDRINGISQNPNVPNSDGSPYTANGAAGAVLGKDIGSSTAGAGIVSSSDPVVANENGIKNTVANLSVPDPNAKAVQDASDNYMKLLQTQQSQLETQRQSEIKAIEGQFGEAKRQTGIQQDKETATTSTALQRIGGYLGGSASAVGALNNLFQLLNL